MDNKSLELDNIINREIRKINIEDAIKHEPQYSLKDLLNFRTVNELKMMSKMFRIPKTSKLKKNELIDVLYEHIKTPAFLEGIINIIREEDWYLLRMLMENKINKNLDILCTEYTGLMKICLLWVFYYKDDLYFIVPTEYRTNYKELEKKGIADYKDLLCDVNIFAKASVNLYGIIELDEFVDIFNKYFASTFANDKIISVLEHHINVRDSYGITDKYLVHKELAGDVKTIHALANVVKAKPRYMPNIEDFLLFRDFEYSDAYNQLEALYDYIFDNMHDDIDVVDEIVDNISIICRMENDVEDCIEFLEEVGIVFQSEQQFDDVVQLIDDIINNTRIWSNKGYTPFEMTDKPVTKNLTLLSNEPR
jgi:hypothetical protein